MGNNNIDLDFSVAQREDYDRVLDFLRDNFFHEEPINCAYPHKDFKKDEEFFMSLLPEGNIVLALDIICGELAGLVGFGEITEEYSNESMREANETTNKTWSDILKFMSFIESKASVCKRFDVPVAIHLHGVAVSKKYRGKGMGKILFQKCFEYAQLRGYKMVSADCSSIYSIKIAEQLGMEFISSVTYDEYHDHIGTTVFHPIPPNIVIKSYVKHIK